MHIDPSRAGIKEITKKSCKYRFYKDKVDFYFDTENQGLLVAKESNEIVGFIIVSRSISYINKSIFKKGYALKWFINTMMGRYGFNRQIIKKYIDSLSVFVSNKVKYDRENNIVSLPDAKIIAIVVLKEKRNQGIGSELIRKACQYISEQGIEEILVTTSLHNEIAQRCYKNLGFKERGFFRDTIGQAVYLTKQV